MKISIGGVLPGRSWLAAAAAFAVLSAGCAEAPQSASNSGRSATGQSSAAASASPETLPAPSPTADPLPTGGGTVLPIPTDVQAAMVERHTDGDTLAIRALATGAVLASTSQITVRLLEIDTPETKKPGTPVQCYGPQASAHLVKIAPLGAKVYVAADKERTDRFGRDLLYLWDAEGVSINLALVEGGFAKAVLYAPNDRYITVLRGAEAKAKAAKRGLWGACAAPAPPAAKRAPAPTNPAPPPSRGNCDPAYPSVCIPPGPPDLDCGEISHRRFTVLAPDPHGFDADNDGLGCESG